MTDMSQSYTFRIGAKAQLAEWSLPIPEVCSFNPVIVKNAVEHLFTVNCIGKTKRKRKKRPGMDNFLNKEYRNYLD